VAWTGGLGRRNRPARPRPQRTPFFYWPLAGPFLLVAAGLGILLVALLLVGALTYALGRLGIAPDVAGLVLLASLLGSAVNVPVARFHGPQHVEMEPYVSAFGMRYYVPVLRSPAQVLAVNVGGALVPAALSGYLIAHDRLGWLALAAVAIVGFLVHLVARPVQGVGIAVPTLLPGLLAVLTAVVLHPHALAGLAYVGGTLGTLVGADLTNLGKVRRMGAPVSSIGGAGTFDGVFLTGITAVLFASLL
jgi:uncharacterized membrane protein